MTNALNASALKDTTCHRCQARIGKGDRCLMFRERAISYHEAAHAGTWYPMRRWCAECAKTRVKPC